ncbi:MAG: VCBS repeat-containing protein, partial [Acidobacteriota bacterium]|nr:VCBS repeat-containing protein [Acidobacteriota bacterium]
EHIVEPNIPGGYSVMVVDVNHDGKPDVIGLTQRSAELAWYENPTWQRHVLINGISTPVNMAAADIDGDGIPEIALETGFSMVAAKSQGLVWLLRHDGDPRGLWKATGIDQIATSHHIAWADIDGDGKPELINAPLIGPNALAPKYEDHVPLLYYRQDGWQRRTIDDQLYGIQHRVRPVDWFHNGREQLLTTGFDGIVLHSSTGTGANLKWTHMNLSKGHQEDPPRKGTSDVAIGHFGNARFLGAVEPWHGNEVVVYTSDAQGAWQRHVIFDGMVEGHEVVVGDFNGDGLDDIVTGDRGKAKNVHIFYAQDGTGEHWEHHLIDEGGMAGSGCVKSDINGDGRLDVVCIGSLTGNLKWYENLGQ